MARSRPFLHQCPPRRAGGGVYATHDDSGAPLIRLQTLGAATVLVGESRLSAAAGTLFSLLVRVAYAPGMLLGRDVLLRSLWPEQDEVRQRANLRQALYKLRGHGVRIALVGDVVQLDGSQVHRTFSLERVPASFEQDVTLGHEPFGQFLIGLEVPWPEFQEWIEAEREAAHAEVRRVLAAELRRRRERADWGGAEALARWLLLFDSLNEEATLTIAECTALAGSKHEAMAILDRFLAELGPLAGDIRLPATLLRKRIAEPPQRGRRSMSPTERHFIGREELLASLTLAMRRARWNDGSAVLLHGGPGIGKTRLLEELEKVARIEGVRVAFSPCRESEQHRPLAIFMDLVPELLSQSGALGCDPGSLAALRRLVAIPKKDDTSDTREAVARSLSQHGPLTNATLVREPFPLVSSIRKAIVDLLSAVTDDSPLILMVDDSHWIDEQSWDVLSDVLDRAHSMRVLVVLTSREPHARPPSSLRVPRGLMILEVPPISPENTLLLSRALGDDLSAPVSDEIGDWFVRASGGNPLFLRALVNHWIETGDAGGIPPTLIGIINQSLSQLSGTALRLLQTATLMGRWATEERVVDCLQLKFDDTLRLFSELELNGMIRAGYPPAVSSHQLIGALAIDHLQPITKSLLHKQIARSLTYEYQESAEEELFLPILCHLRDASEWQKMVMLISSRRREIDLLFHPVAILDIIESIPRQELSSDARRIIGGISSDFRVQCGLYRDALNSDFSYASLPNISDLSNPGVAQKALAFVDGVFRTDSNYSYDELIDYTIRVSRVDSLPRQLRFRAGEIGLVILSNQCESERAHRLWQKLALAESDFYCCAEATRFALLYHTAFGTLSHAAELAAFLFENAKRNSAAGTASVNAIRAGFALRISSSDEQSIAAFRFAYDSAISQRLPVVAMNAAWQLAQCFLESGALDDYQAWKARLARLHGESSERVLLNFAPALFCREAIEYSDAEKASKYFEEFLEDLPVNPTVRTAGHTQALRTAISLLDARWIPPASQLNELARYSELVTNFGIGDFFASVNVDALLRVNPASATRFFKKYQSVLRRETSKLSLRLTSSASRLSEL